MIDCRKCEVSMFCGTMVSSLRLCRAAHPEYFEEKEKETTITTSTDNSLVP